MLQWYIGINKIVTGGEARETLRNVYIYSIYVKKSAQC